MSLPAPPGLTQPTPRSPRKPAISVLGLGLIVALVVVLGVGWSSRKGQKVDGASPSSHSSTPSISRSPAGAFGSFSGDPVKGMPCCWQRWTMDTGAVSVEAPTPPSYWTHPNERGVGFQGATGTNLSVSEDRYPGSSVSLTSGTAKAIRTGSTLEWSRPIPVHRSGFTGLQMHTIASNAESHVDFTIWLFASQDRLYTIQAQFMVENAAGRRAVRRFLGSVRVALPTSGAQP